jgi:hypothetical protein
MGDPKGFMTIPRKDAGYRPVNDRIHDYGEVEQTLNDERQSKTGIALHGLWNTVLPLGLPRGK